MFYFYIISLDCIRRIRSSLVFYLLYYSHRLKNLQEVAHHTHIHYCDLHFVAIQSCRDVSVFSEILLRGLDNIFIFTSRPEWDRE